jgi:hypothetical protein
MNQKEESMSDNEKTRPDRLSDVFSGKAEPSFASQAQANGYFQSVRAAILDRQEREKSRIAFEYSQACARIQDKVVAAYRPLKVDLARLHGREQRFAVAKSTGPLDRTLFIAANRQRLSRHKRLSPREIGAMIRSPDRFARALSALHLDERTSLDRKESAAYRANIQPTEAEYRRSEEAVAMRARAELNTELGRFISSSPDSKAAREHYQTRFAPHLAVEAPAPPPAEPHPPVQAFSAKARDAGHIFERRSEQIRIDMQNWLKTQPQRQRDDGREM